MYANTGDEIYLPDDRNMAQQAVYYKGLFRGPSAWPYYCAVDDSGHLLVALIQLDRVIELRDSWPSIYSDSPKR